MKTREIIPSFYLIVLLLSIGFSVYSSFLFMNGFHNLDLGQNINILNAKQGLSLIDINSQGEEWTGTEMYFYGWGNMKQAFTLLGISMFLFGFSLSKLIKIR